MGAFQHVLVGLDLHSANASALLSRACQIASSDQIEVVHVCDHLHSHHEDYGAGEIRSSEELDERIIADADAQLDKLCRDFGITHHQALTGKTADALHEYAREHSDLVVVGSHGRYGLQTMFGSTSNAVVHGTPCDVLAVHVTDDPTALPGTYDNVLVAVNLADESSRVMEHALGIAESADAALAVCHVYASHDEHTRAQERISLERLGMNHNIPENMLYSLSGTTVHAIRDLAKEIGADLIVVGTHGKQGLELIKGSTVNAVLHGAQCDVLSVRVGQA